MKRSAARAALRTRCGSTMMAPMRSAGTVLLVLTLGAPTGCVAAKAGTHPPAPTQAAASPSASASASRSPDPAKRALRVALFPYLPDANEDHFASLLRFLETEFERMHPEIDLRLRPLDPENEAMPFYTPETLAGWLTATSGEAYDVVEADLEMLDYLVEGAAEPWSILEHPLVDWHSAATAAATSDGRIWAYPHLLCGHFVITRDPAVAATKSGFELAAAVRSTRTKRLVGDFGGSWNLPSLFLDAYADTHGAERVADGMALPLDRATTAALTEIEHLCAPAGGEECVGAFHERPDDAKDVFARGEAAAFLGFSESLNRILTKRTDSAELLVASAPLGGGSHPVLFTDGLTLRRGCVGVCQEDARAFAELLTSARTNEILMLSKDASPAAKPRYLLPASKAAFRLPSIAADPLYATLGRAIANGGSFPNRGLARVRGAMKNELIEAFRQPRPKLRPPRPAR